MQFNNDILISAFQKENFTEEQLAVVPDLKSPEISSALFTLLKDIYNTRMPFNSYLGIDVSELSLEKALVKINSRQELQGNYIHSILHGGVISSVIDLSGGIIAQAHAISGLHGLTFGEIIKRFSKMSTISMRVDYLRPGAGDHFSCISYVLRAGNKVAATRMDMYDQEDRMIATGTGSYLIG